MALSIELDFDGPVFPGDELRVDVEVEAGAPKNVGGIELQLEGACYVLRGGGQVRRSVVSRTARVAGPRVLRSGTHRFQASFQLPEGAPPTLQGGGISVRYAVRCDVLVPFWLNDSTTRVVLVEPPPLARRPRSARTATTGRDANLFIEVMLDDSAFARGDTVTGAFSLANIQRRLDGGTVSLVVEGRSDGERVARTTHASVFRSLTNAREGSVVPFEIAVPEDVPYTFVGRGIALEAFVEVRVDGTPAVVEIPIVLGPFPRAGAMAPASRPIGVDHWRGVWKAESAALGFELDVKRLRMRGRIDDLVDASIEPRGGGLGAELRWESFGLDLAIEPRGLLDDISMAPYAVTGREKRQVAAILTEELIASLSPFKEPRVTDIGASLSAPAASPRDPDHLRSFVEAVVDLARAVMRAEANVPPPGSLSSCGPAWRAFRAATGGRLHLGRLSLLEGRFDGEPFHLETTFDGVAAAQTRLTLVLDPPVPPRSITISKDLEHAVLEEVRRLSSNADAARAARVKRRSISVDIDRALDDPASLRPLFGRLLLLARSFRRDGHRGPYR
jgi:sporulation-control protein spo0M